MASAVDQITGVIPIAVAGGVTMRMTEAALGGKRKRARRLGPVMKGSKRVGGRPVKKRGISKGKIGGMGPYLSERGPRTLAARKSIPKGGDYHNVGL